MTIDTAMVMAAGHGTRMRPLTNTTCKALVDIGGAPLIDHMLARLRAAGIQKAVVNVHSFAKQLISHLHARDFGLEIQISDERAGLLDTGGAVVKALPRLGNAPFLICNIDAVWIEFEHVLPGLLAAWDANKMDELFLLAPSKGCLGYNGDGDFYQELDGRLIMGGPKPRPFVFAGVEIMKPEFARGYDPVAFSRSRIWKQVFANRRAFGYNLPGYWMHVGDPRARAAAQAVLQQHAALNG